MQSDPVFIGDPLPLALDGLSSVVREHWDLLAATTDLLELAVLAQHGSGLFVLAAEFGLNRLGWFLKSLQPGSRTLLVIAAPNDEAVRLGLQYRVNGFIDRRADSAQYAEAIAAVMNGQSYVSPALEGPVARIAMESEIARRTSLTPRELEVLQLVADGKSSRDVAARLSISTKTVEFHRGKLFAKLGVRSAIELVRCALSLGLLGAQIAAADINGEATPEWASHRTRPADALPDET